MNLIKIVDLALATTVSNDFVKWILKIMNSLWADENLLEGGTSKAEWCPNLVISWVVLNLKQPFPIEKKLINDIKSTEKHNFLKEFLIFSSNVLSQLFCDGGSY